MPKLRKNTILEFRKLGHRVIVVAPKDGYSKYFADLGAEYYTFNLSPRSINPFKEIFFASCFKLKTDGSNDTTLPDFESP